MLAQSTLDSYANPIDADAPSGLDLGYDADFLELETLSTPKPEQQFGDSIIPGEEPNWGIVTEKAENLLLRSKDFRIGIFLTRGLTHKNGIQGFLQGLQVLTGFAEQYWDTLHPQLDADDDNDPTMRVNALAALWDVDMLLKDLRGAKIGGVGASTLRVNDVEAHFSKAYSSNEPANFSIDQVQATLAEISEADPLAFEATQACLAAVKQLQTSINDKVSSQSSVDLSSLQGIAYALNQATQAAKGTANSEESEQIDGSASSGPSGTSGGSGGLKTRDDAIRILSQVITFLEKSEPGNPAPLLIKRAQRLIGMNFIDIINDLAPEALNSVQNIAGRSDES